MLKTDRDIMWAIGSLLFKEYKGVFLNEGEILYLAEKHEIGRPKRFLRRWLRPFATEHGKNLWKVHTDEEHYNMGKGLK